MAPITAAALEGKKDDLVAILDAGAQYGKVCINLTLQGRRKVKMFGGASANIPSEDYTLHKPPIY